MIRTSLVFLAVLAALAVRASGTKAKRQSTGSCVRQDLVYMIDSSSAVGPENFYGQLEFIKRMVSQYTISPMCTQVGIVTYSSNVHNQFYLNQYSNKQTLLNAISGITYHPGRTHMAEAINYVTQTSFSTLHGARSGVPHIGILVSGSASNSPSATMQAANQARASGVTLYTVGVGSGVNGGELSGSASEPSGMHYMTAQSFESLPDLAGQMSTRIAGTVNPSSLGTPTSCLQQADLVFLTDGSGSIGSANFDKLRNFMKGIVGKLDVGPNKVHVGMMEFSNYPSMQFSLDQYNNRQDVMHGIDKMPYMGGGTNTADAIKYMRQQMFSQNSGARSGVPRIAVVITDGRSANPTATQTEADNARMAHINMLAIGVGNGVSVSELHNIADDPDSQNSFTVSNYDQLDSIVTSIIQRACQARATAAPKTNQPKATHPPDPCQDKLHNCRDFKQSDCASYPGWAKDNCAKYCGICSPLYTDAPPPCVDKLTNCHSYQSDTCLDPKFSRWATDNCRRFCGFCGPKTSSTGFFGKCYYKGKSYNHGESWDDGCDYQCTCEDGATGKYKCYNKCPVYYNLPSQCTLVKDPKKCCQVPVCNFNQKVNTFTTQMPGRTPDGINVCVYKNNNYYQGQTWNDGCKYSCTCTSSATGTYRCQDRCATYSSIPSYCKMEKKPGDCCAKPVCEFKTQQGSFTGVGSISGPGMGTRPTAPPPCVDKLADCARYETGFCQKFAPWAKDNCRKHCKMCEDTEPTPSPGDKTKECLYQGTVFHQGQSWKVGCDMICTCENANYGYYRCTSSCPTYNNLPSGCYETKKAGDCCSTIQCDTGKFISSTNNLLSLGNGGMINVGPTPAVRPTLSSGAPAPIGTGGTGNTAPTLHGCLYKGQLYLQNQAWEDECQYSCQCTDANTGLYTCKPKCPIFPNLPSECHLEVDASDPCCKKPKCTFTGQPVPVFPVFQPSTTSTGAVRPPSPSELTSGTYTIQTIIDFTPNTPAPVTAKPGAGFCVYKGKQYQQGQTWEDGCDYNCACENGATGFYRCRQKCYVYNPADIPAPYCKLVQDPKNACCKVPKCNITGTYGNFSNTGVPILPTFSPTTGPTPAPAPKVCVYKGKNYVQGQSWYDGCDYKCTCDNAQQGLYRCLRRCPEYFNIPSTCHLVSDPQDPTCCRVPVCTTSKPGVIPTLQPGTFSGQPNTTSTNIGYCDYKGQHYRQGQTWSDGCDYTCSCENENTGNYRCVEKCPRYANLPAACRLITDFANPCCMKPDCVFNPQTGEFTGHGTPAPPLNPSPQPGAPSPGTNPAPRLTYCVYKGAKYVQGQTWDDGCQFRCRCDDASKGLYVCDDRCPKYPAIPPQCKMVTDQRDSCCQKPQCNFTPTVGQITGTLAPNMIPTQVPGIITGSAKTPAPTPGPDGRIPTPKPLDYCEYKGNQYKQGQTWDDGCDLKCTCTDAMHGKYTCTDKCPKYPSLPRQCTLTKDPANPCCTKPVCNFTPTSGGITGTLPPGVPQPGHTQAPIPGQSTVAPNPQPYPSPSLPKSVCDYRGKSYTQGQRWYDGCDYICNCEDAMKGIYRCTRRCGEYSNLPSSCSLVKDPKDPLCCKVPECHFPSTLNTTTGQLPTPPPATFIGGSVNPTPRPQPVGPTPGPGVPGVSTLAPHLQPTPGPQPKVCVYNGKSYQQGQRWQDGCDYNCECYDAMQGLYRCTELCPRYTNLPSACTLVQDPYKPCCKKPDCHFTGKPGELTGHNTPSPNVGPTLAPSPGGPQPSSGPTLAPQPKKLCNYNGVMYKKGQQWQDGCDLVCICEDDMTGYYRCNKRCATYQVPAYCTMQTDPNDACCRVPNCPPPVTQAPNPNVGPTLAPSPGYNPSPGPNPSPGYNPSPGPNPGPSPGPNYTPIPYPNPNPVPTVPSAIIPGQGVTPSPQPAVGGTTSNPVCVYSGVGYGQGEKWRDGCRYICECTDAHTGQYICKERCARYASIPSYCRMIVDPNDSCCKIPQCSQPPTLAPNPNVNPTPSPSLRPGQSPMPNPSPNPSSGPSPNPGGSPTPGPMPTPAPVPKPREVCRMNGREYTPGQKWTEGCNKICVCEDGKTGYYRCTDRCQQYKNIPSQCTMVPDPKDPLCCQVPSCIPGSNGQPTPAPNPTNKPTVYTNIPHAIVTGSGTPPPPTPGPSGAPTPAPRKVCVYKNQQYIQGQRWRDGCDYNCVCDDGMTGKYTCTKICPDYPNVPPQCRLQRDPKDFCCYVMACDWNQTPSPSPPIQPTPGVPGVSPTPGVPGHQTPQPQPGVSTPAPHIIPGMSPTPGPNPNPVNTPAPSTAFCVYNGVPFRQGQTLNDGCTQKCRCDDASMNYYNCFDRCPSYNLKQLQSHCTMVTDPNDPCCQVPQCYVVPSPQPTPGPGPNPLNPSPLPGQSPNPLNPSPLPGQSPNPLNPSPLPGQSPNPNPGQSPNPFPHQSPGPNPYPQTTLSPNPTVKPSPVPTAVPGVIVNKPNPKNPGYCMYYGRKYTKGQTWDDGCTYQCVCLDDMTGQYKCTERCPKYPSIPSYCVMVEDPNDRCCKKPSCPGSVPTPSPSVQPTPGPYVHPSPGQPGYSPTPRPGQPGYSPLPGQPGYSPTPGPGQPGYSPLPGQPGYSPTPRPVQPGQSTLAPNIQPTPIPAPTPNPQPVPKYVCIMNGKSYTQGQQWYDGCKQICVCDDAVTGRYTCNQRCPAYNNIAPTCVFVPDPNDPVCCQIPQCNPNPNKPTGVKGTINGTNQPLPTPGPNPNPNPNPNPSSGPNPTPNPYIAPTPGPGLTYPPGMVPTPGQTVAPPLLPGQSPSPGQPQPSSSYPGPNIQPTPQPQPKVCVYKGQMYKQGQKWRDGCTYDCVCVDAEHGNYQCTDVCPRYPNLPPTCRMVYDPLNPCCKKPECNTNPSVAPSPVPGVSTLAPSPGSNVSPSPGSNPNPNPNPTPTTQFCVYNGVPVQKGQTFKDGCSKVCRCEDADMNRMVCDERCPTYPALASGCTLITDPKDACCQVPQCPPPNPITNPGSTSITGVPGTITGSTIPVTGGPNPPITGKNNVCLYHGRMYNTGDKWDDGCTYRCVCIDGNSGSYRCTQRCARYPNPPSYCTMVTDANDKCCMKPFCQPPQIAPTPGPNPTPYPNPNPQPGVSTNVPIPGVSYPQPQPGVSTNAPIPGVNPSPTPGAPNPNINPTPAPKPKGVCEYKNQYYRQDQVWYDDCNAVCKCEDANMNYHRCQERCARYTNIPTQCTLVPDPKDPSCCKVPSCPVVPTPGPGGAVPTPGYVAPNPHNTPAPGVITGLAPVPTPQTPYPSPQPGSNPSPQPGVPNPSQGPTPYPVFVPSPGPGVSPNPNPNPKKGCLYHGMVYPKGTKWDDGCQYNCECLDDMTGQYRCTERCQSIPNVPYQCVKMPDPKDKCCKTLYCDFKNPTPFPHGYPTPVPNSVQTPIPGQTPVPGMPVPTPGNTPAPTPQPAGYCVYKGSYYKQGQTWDDGCSKKCRCEDVMTGYYTCSDRCASYNNLPSNCQLRTNPNDPCCLVPDCNSFTVNPNVGPGASGTRPPGYVNPTPGPGISGTRPPGSVNPSIGPGISGTNPPGGVVTNKPGPGISGSNPPGVTPTPKPLIVVPTYIPGTFTGTGVNPVQPGGFSGSTTTCYYKGNQYQQGQKWDDGCTLKCECVDANRGQYRCTERCPKYYYLPPQCVYKQDPNDACCRIASCDLSLTPTPLPGTPTPAPQPGVPTNPITINPGSGTGPSGHGHGPSPVTNVNIVTGTRPPGVSNPVTVNPNPNPGTSGNGHGPNPVVTGPGGFTGTRPPVVVNPGGNTGFGGSNPPTIVYPTGSTLTGSRDRCIYKDNSMHAKGTTWQDGCQLTCRCDDPVLNDYKCTNRCPVFADLPSFCTLQDNPSDPCCKKPVCNSPTGNFNPMTGGNGPYPSPTLSPSITNVIPVGTHSVFSGSGLPPGTSVGTPGVTGGRSVCVYKKTMYQQGASWDDGCDYTCTCTDAQKGLYRCTSKCPKYPPVPSYCKMINVPGQCCPSMDCNIPNYGRYTPTPQLVPTIAPSPQPGAVPTTSNPLMIYPSGTGGSTGGSRLPGNGAPVPPGYTTGNIRDKCVYKNKMYNQGEKWTDGCDYQCECIESRSGYYECKPLCPVYNNLPSECYLVRATGQCCSNPMCQNPDGSTTNPLTSPTSVYPVVGSYTGGFTGFRPGYTPRPSTFGGRPNVCIYKSSVYAEGQSWEDGCDYTCQCTDGKTGVYTCHQRCSTYTKIPSPTCRLVDVPGQCCKDLRCNPRSTPAVPVLPHTVSPPLTGCVDTINNCPAYGKSACTGKYVQWAQNNCRLYCGFCSSSSPTPSPTCTDKLTNCAAFGKSACTGVYVPWAKDNCKRYCNLCNQVTTPAPTNPSGTACVDKISNCAQYTKAACNAPYEEWALKNCQNFCGKCGTNVPQTGTGQPTNTNWMILMKGVAGVPGDLYQLWNSPNTANANVPSAMYLTSTYPGHYKPGLSNYWNSLCIDMVKVAIFDKGVEKANIVFNAIGADKNSWFTPSRIISSTWTDIRYAPKNIFSLLGDQMSGHEFLASSSGSGCNSNGWLMVSTKNGCTFEQGSNKPAFYYSRGTSATNFQNTVPGTGDVFAILAHTSNNCSNTIVTQNPMHTFVSVSNFCIYKGKIYNQGDYWKDGCQYNCTCEDSRTGFYRCRDLCPVYTYIPPGHRLIKKPGECCSTIDPPISGPNGGGTGCYYKGQTYLQDQKWRDGCDYKCTCEDASKGFYRCNNICLNWNLPKQCHMDPAPSGKCCPVPNCPSNVLINYPANFVQE